jgi:metallo-beta-lactamase family protein
MIVMTDFQAAGTRGAALAAGASSIRIHGRDVDIKAEVVQLQSASAHADGNQLLGWLRTMPEAPAQVYVVHGELEQPDAFRKRIKHELGWRVWYPNMGQLGQPDTPIAAKPGIGVALRSQCAKIPCSPDISIELKHSRPYA